ncbi:PAS domain S-box protein, partial [Desulfosarcina sp.]|uniref:PAS domain S-box protein n=1 Tax=Desulfosarcina sp. TaxID=2027861 RepID=UPI003970E958
MTLQNDDKRVEQSLRKSQATITKKLQAILEAEGDIGVLNLGDIIDSLALQAMMDDFYRLTRIGCAIVDLAGQVLVAVGWQDVCTRFHRVHPESLKNCTESDIFLSNGVPAGTFKAYRCKNNMWDIATPIKVGGRHLGNLFLGQFFFADEVPDDALFRSQARQYGFDEETYLDALHRVPRWSRETIDAVMSFYAKLAGMISSLGYSTVRLARAMAQQEAAFDQLARSEEKYRRITENISDVVWIADLNLKTTYVSPSIERLVGEPDTAHLQRTMEEKLPPDSLNRLYAVLAEELEREKDPDCDKKRSRLIEVQHYRADGSLIWIAIHVSAVRDEAGNLSGLQGVVRDITDSKRMEEALRASEERFRLLSDLTMEGVLIHRHGIVKDLNASLAKILGYERAELLGKNILELAIYPDDKCIARANIVKDYAEPYIVRAVKKDGSVFYAELEARNFQLKDEVLRVAAVRDVTDRMATQEALRRSEERYRDLFENVSDFLYFHDLDGNFIETNLALKHAHGYSPEEFEKISVRSLMPEEVRPEFDDYLQRIVENGADEGLFPVVHKDGSVIITEYKNLLVRDSEGKPVGVRGSARDITAKLKAEKKNRQLEAKLHQAQKMEAMGRMAGAVAHHFNNQLAVVQGNLELAMEDLPAREATRALLSEAMQAANRSSEISTLMLTYLGQSGVKGEPLDLSDVCRQHEPSLRETLPDGVALETDFADLGPVVRGAAHQIHQVLTHLIANACEAIGDRGGKVTLTTRVIPATEIPKSQVAQADWQPATDSYACLEVVDTGCGITSDN